MPPPIHRDYFQPMADLAKTPRELVKKDSEFATKICDKEVHGQCLDQVKQGLIQASVPKFFDPQNKTVLQCDASMSGLGACLMHDENLWRTPPGL